VLGGRARARHATPSAAEKTTRKAYSALPSDVRESDVGRHVIDRRVAHPGPPWDLSYSENVAKSDNRLRARPVTGVRTTRVQYSLWRLCPLPLDDGGKPNVLFGAAADDSKGTRRAAVWHGACTFEQSKALEALSRSDPSHLSQEINMSTKIVTSLQR
jgi:hypothetical protein